MGSRNEIAPGGLLRLVNINNLKLAGNSKPSWYNIANRWLVLLQIASACVSFLCCKEKLPSCSVPGCNNRSEKDRVRGVSFHSLPVKKPLVPKYVYSGEHFTQDCFETEYRFQLLGGNTHIRSLKTGSVPTIFKWKAPVKVPDISEAEQERKEEC